MGLSIGKLILLSLILSLFSSKAIAQPTSIRNLLDDDLVMKEGTCMYFLSNNAYHLLRGWYIKYEMVNRIYDDDNTGERLTLKVPGSIGALYYENTGAGFTFIKYEEFPFYYYNPYGEKIIYNWLDTLSSYRQYADGIGYGAVALEKNVFFGICPPRPTQNAECKDEFTNPNDMVCEENFHGGEYILEDGTRREH